MPKVVLVFHPEMAESVNVNLVGPLTAAIPGVEVELITGCGDVAPQHVEAHLVGAAKVIVAFSEEYLYGEGDAVREICFALAAHRDHNLWPVVLPGTEIAISDLPMWIRMFSIADFREEIRREIRTEQLIAAIKETANGHG